MKLGRGGVLGQGKHLLGAVLIRLNWQVVSSSEESLRSTSKSNEFLLPQAPCQPPGVGSWSVASGDTGEVRFCHSNKKRDSFGFEVLRSVSSCCDFQPVLTLTGEYVQAPCQPPGVGSWSVASGDTGEVRCCRSRSSKKHFEVIRITSKWFLLLRQNLIQISFPHQAPCQPPGVGSWSVASGDTGEVWFHVVVSWYSYHSC